MKFVCLIKISVELESKSTDKCRESGMKMDAIFLAVFSFSLTDGRINGLASPEAALSGEAVLTLTN